MNGRPKVFVVTSGKGGVGKTTFTANLGCTLAKMGERVCLIDADIGLKNLDVVLGLENRIIYTSFDVANGTVSAKEALVKHKQLKNLYLLAASQVATKEMMAPEDMKRIVRDLYDEFDFILIDSPAGIERGFRNSVAPAEAAFIVTTPELPAISDADRVIGLLENYGFTEDKMYIILNKFKPHMAKRGDMLDKVDVEKALAMRLLGVIPDSEEVIIATNKGIPAVLEDGFIIAKSFENIVRRIKGEDIPVDEDLKSLSKNFISSLLSLFKKR
ncbi:MAG: septum site-determining protein MinD [Fervidobacterium sp.]